MRKKQSNGRNMNPTIAQYVPVADLIVQTFGEDCEVVLHDLETPQRSVVYVANNRVTGREIGQNFEHLVPQVILSDKLENDIVANYYFTSKDGKLIKSSTALLRDFDGNIVGAMCINLDTSKITQNIAWLQALLPDISRREAAEEVAEKPPHITEIVTDLINKIIGKQDASSLRREEKLEMISFMDSRGIFLMKGAVEQVAAKMNITKVTVYSYLDEVRGKK